MLYLKQVQNNANSRFTFESGKSQVPNPKNSVNPENIAQPENQNQTQLRETGADAEKSRAKLDVACFNKIFRECCFAELGLSICCQVFYVIC
jgi:hypothetical protein